MQYRVERIENQFQAQEASDISGVSPTLQRDWRRRELLPERQNEGRMRFTLHQIIELAVMKRLSDAGMSVKSTKALAWQAVVSVQMALESMPEAIEVRGADLSRGEIFDLLRSLEKPIVRQSINCFALPELPEGSASVSAFVASSWEDLGKMIEEAPEFSTGFVMDAVGFAREIVANAKRPLITYQLHQIDPVSKSVDGDE